VSRARSAVAVVVPARNERDLITACVRSIRRSLATAAVDGWIVVVADDCTDDTAARARLAIGAGGEVVERHLRSVGAARRLGCQRARRRFGTAPAEDLVLLSTDADSVVAPNWVGAHLAALDRGVAAIAGTVVVDSFGDRHPRLRRHFEHVYAPRRGGNHSHVHGANLSVRADAYLAVGGFQPVATGEEHDLWARLRAAGYRVASTAAAPVRTSGRRVGRAPAGFADYLNTLESLVHEVA